MVSGEEEKERRKRRRRKIFEEGKYLVRGRNEEGRRKRRKESLSRKISFCGGEENGEGNIWSREAKNGEGNGGKYHGEGKFFADGRVDERKEGRNIEGSIRGSRREC